MFLSAVVCRLVVREVLPLCRCVRPPCQREIGALVHMALPLFEDDELVLRVLIVAESARLHVPKETSVRGPAKDVR